jgi:superfamily II DNA or RNA helicase
MSAQVIRLAFDADTLVVAGGPTDRLLDLPGVRFDPRTNAHRAESRYYRAIVEQLRANKADYTDDARSWQQTPWPLRMEREPFPHQTEAVETWWRERGRGVVVLPTGSGKTFMAILAIAKAARPALIVTPTIDLLNQ